MVRAPYFDENGLKKGAWSPDEDEKLKAYVHKHGHCNWRELPRFAGNFNPKFPLSSFFQPYYVKTQITHFKKRLLLVNFVNFSEYKYKYK